MSHRLPISLLALVLAAVSPAAAHGPTPTTPAEKASFRSTPSYDETLAYIRELQEHTPVIDLQFFGQLPGLRFSVQFRFQFRLGEFKLVDAMPGTSRNPVQLAELVEHRAFDSASGIRAESDVPPGVKVFNCTD